MVDRKNLTSRHGNQHNKQLRHCMTKRKFSTWLPLLISLSMVAGMFVGFKLRDGMPGKSFFHTERRKPVMELLQLIEDKYVDPVQANALADTAIHAMLNSLDPHSVYIPAELLQEVNDDIRGSFSGIGVEFNVFSDTMHVIQVIPGGPADRAGLMRGDKVIKADGKLLAGKKYPSDSIRKYLRGEAGSDVTLTLIRNQKSLDKTIRRGQIPMSSVDAAFMVDAKTGFIRLNRFSSQTYREFMLALDSLVKAGMQSLVLDLRENGGGVLDEAVEIADEFLEGDKLITYTEGRKFPRKEYRCRRNGMFEKGKLVVLADENTASASEVLLGALQDWDRATIIGRSTFGKGLVQEQYNLSDQSAVRLTIARYYTPTGRSIQRPYDNGRQAYYENHAQREIHSDSMAVSDTGKAFQTRAGKKIYAGGGISPDILIPADSLGLTEQVLKAVARGLVNDAAYFWLIQHPGLEKRYASAKAFSAGQSENASIRSVFTGLAAKDSIQIISYTEKETIYLDQRLKAAVTRLIWRNEGYFEAIFQHDTTMQKALEVLRK